MTDTARTGHRHGLLVYEHMLNRWWPTTLVLALALIVLGWLTSRDLEMGAEPWRANGLWIMGGVAMLVTLAFFLMRRAAYIQPRREALRLVTPFLRLDISYRRIRSTSTATFGSLFPARRLHGWKRDLLEPLGPRTALVIELNGFPIPEMVLRMFLSPLFFKDRTPHLVIVVKDWMGFSAEMESLRFSGPRAPGMPPRDSITSRLPRRK